MTENEAIERIIRSACSSGKCYDACLYGEGNCEYDAAITALKEVQRYREIGTVEECKELASMVTTEKKNVLGKIVDEWNEYIEIGTVEECREAVEKRKPKKCVNDFCPDHTHYKCPSCGKIQKTKYGDSEFGCILNYCSNCGQAIDENLEGMEDE